MHVSRAPCVSPLASVVAVPQVPAAPAPQCAVRRMDGDTLLSRAAGRSGWAWAWAGLLWFAGGTDGSPAGRRTDTAAAAVSGLNQMQIEKWNEQLEAGTFAYKENLSE